MKECKKRAVLEAISRVSAFDTAQIYGNEEGVGAAIKRNQASLARNSSWRQKSFQMPDMKKQKRLSKVFKNYKQTILIYYCFSPTILETIAG